MKKLVSIAITMLLSWSAFAQTIPYGNDGLVDPSSNAFVVATPWPKCNITYFFQNYTADVPTANSRTAIQGAFASWAAVTNLTFTEVATAGAADIVILWGTGNHGDASPFDGVSGVLAHAYFPGFGTLAGDVHFDDAETWSTSGTGSMDLQTVAVHEIGHALGMDHSTVTTSVMYAFYSGVRRSLTSDDISGIRTIYPSGIQGPGSICASGTNTYTYPNCLGASTYTWTTSSNVTILSGQGTSTITVSATPTPITGQICVTTNTGCSNCRTVGVGSPMPSNITFSQLGSSCEYKATATAVVGATSYQWSTNNFATFYSTSTNVDANTYTAPSTVTLSVRAVTNCGTSATKTVTRTLTKPAGCMARMINADGSVGEEISAINVFPNPSTGIFEIVTPETVVGNTATVYDLSGRMVYSGLITATQSSIDLTSLESGVYVFCIKSSTENYTQRIVVQH